MQQAFDFRLTTESAPAFLTRPADRSSAPDVLDKDKSESSALKAPLAPCPFFVIARDHALADKRNAPDAARKAPVKRRCRSAAQKIQSEVSL